MSPVALEVDLDAGSAYIRLAQGRVGRTVQVTDDVLIDMDDMNVVLGVEVLRLTAKLPFVRLVEDFHVRTEVVDLLRAIQPSVSGFMELTQGSDGSTTSIVPTTAVLASTHA